MGEEVTGARDVRAEDAFDVAAVDAWLRSTVDASRWGDGPPQVRQFSGVRPT